MWGSGSALVRGARVRHRPGTARQGHGDEDRLRPGQDIRLWVRSVSAGPIAWQGRAVLELETSVSMASRGQGLMALGLAEMGLRSETSWAGPGRNSKAWSCPQGPDNVLYCHFCFSGNNS